MPDTDAMKRDAVNGARRVYEVHRRASGRNRGPAMPSWDDLAPDDRLVLVARHRALMAAYDRGRKLPRERRIEAT